MLAFLGVVASGFKNLSVSVFICGALFCYPRFSAFTGG